MIKRPLLAEELETLESLKLPVIASPKVDGIRCLNVDGKIVTRSFKPIPNNYIRTTLEAITKDGFDGEIVTGQWLDSELFDFDDFNTIQSKVMSEEGEPEFMFLAFDYVKEDHTKPFKERLVDLRVEVATIRRKEVCALETIAINNLEKLQDYERNIVRKGYEGIMLRDPNGPYKFGRSTVKEGILLKYKRFEDSEAVILGLEEQFTNIGAKETNELGLTKRSHKKADKAPADTLGEFLVKDVKTGTEFKIGTGQGLTKELRKQIWDNKDKHIGKLIKYKFQGIGSQGRPRFPSFLGFRDERDL